MTELTRHWINGKPWGDSPARTGDRFDPATGAAIGSVAYADSAEVDAAVTSARQAYPGWRDTPLTHRTKILFRYRELVSQHAEDLARLITREHGKTLPDAAGEVERGLEVIEFACGLGHLLKGEFSGQVSRAMDTYSIRQPLGVVAGITPFNFPAMVPLWMFPLAVACGNAFVLKPSEKDPSPATLLAELFSRAGLPDGVFNVVHGDRQAVDALLEHPDVAAVSFVGSTPIAKSIYTRAAEAGKRVQALGGAKNHAVVLPDADVDLAADAIVSAAFGSAGERCMAISAVVAVGPVREPLVAAIAERTRNLRVGSGTEAGVDMGPLITAEHRDRVAAYLDAGARDGAVVVVDGREASVPADGYFLAPSVLDGVTEDMSVHADEIFGPVLSIAHADSLDEAIDLVNRSPYGNGTAVFTSDGAAARTFEDRIEVGMVGVNVPIPVPLAFHSFGGWKQSLFGDLHVYGPDAIRFYTRTKVVTRRWPERASAGLDLGFSRD